MARSYRSMKSPLSPIALLIFLSFSGLFRFQRSWAKSSGRPANNYWYLGDLMILSRGFSSSFFLRIERRSRTIRYLAFWLWKVMSWILHCDPTLIQNEQIALRPGGHHESAVHDLSYEILACRDWNCCLTLSFRNALSLRLTGEIVREIKRVRTLFSVRIKDGLSIQPLKWESRGNEETVTRILNWPVWSRSNVSAISYSTRCNDIL